MKRLCSRRNHVPLARKSLFACCAAFALLASGCGTGEKKVGLRPLEFALESPYAGVKTLAIAPTINLSGSRDFDPLAVSDALFVELQQVHDLNVLPLNKTLMAMNRLGMRTIDDPRAAQKLADALGADALIVPAITSYDPYKPPTVGMILQVYTSPAAEQAAAAAAVAAPVPVKFESVQTNTSGMTVVSDSAPPPAGHPVTPAQQPVAQVSAVFNANNQTVLRELRDFAIGRTQYDSALLEQKFLVDSEAYMRFVCHAMVRRLMDVERIRVADR